MLKIEKSIKRKCDTAATAHELTHAPNNESERDSDEYA